MDEEIWLDLHAEILYGFQASVSEEIVDSIIKGIKLGDVFPDVTVYRNDDNSYALAQSVTDPKTPFHDGGHARAVAHFKEHQPLRCALIDASDDRARIIVPARVEISDIVVKDHPGEFEMKKQEGSFYL